jgi:hypothetical protein
VEGLILMMLMMMMFGLILMFFFHVDDDLSDVPVTIFNPLILFFVLWGTEVTEEELVSGTNEDVELQGLPATASWLLQRLPYQPQAAFASGG